MNENESLTVTLTLDNDEELECAVLTIYEVEGQEYIALLPLDEEAQQRRRTGLSLPLLRTSGGTA